MKQINIRIFFLAETTFNDGRSCNRVCDGRPKTCYYEFDIKKYDTMCGYVLSDSLSFYLAIDRII